MLVKIFRDSWLGRRRVVLSIYMSLIHPSLASGLDIEALGEHWEFQ